MSEIDIEITGIRKDYHYQTIFHQLNHTFRSFSSTAVLGENGSGKSTLLRVLSGMTEPTHGGLHWTLDGVTLPAHRWHEYLSFCSPGLHFDNRFSVEEILMHYLSVKPMQKGMDKDHLIDLMGFERHRNKQMNELSSGMNQRVRLVLTICADVPVLFLDEPCSNLDQQGVLWYNELIHTFASKKLIFVASNDVREYGFCTDQLSLMDYK